MNFQFEYQTGVTIGWFKKTVYIQGVAKKSTYFGLRIFFSFRQIYGMNILILTIHMAGIVKLAMIQAFTAHWKMKIKQMATLLNIGSIITSFSIL